MVRLVTRRLLVSVPLLFVVSVLSFVLQRLAPGNAVSTILAESFGANATHEEYVALQTKLGLNHSLVVQYGNWVWAALHGNLGTSLFTGQSVNSTISSRLPVTVSLVIGSVLLSTVVGVAIGVTGAVRGGALGRSLDAFGLLGFAVPSFWLGVLLIELLAVKVRLLPATGYVPVSTSVGGWLRSLVLPVVALGIGGVAVVARQTRDSLGDVLARDFVRTLRASGVSERSIIFRHGLRNAAIPVVTIIGLLAVGLLSASVAIETVFALPGLGSLAVQAAADHDTPVLQGVVVYFALVVIVVNLLLDVMYGWLNPRARAA